MALIVPPRAARELASAPPAIAKRLQERLELIAQDPFAPHPGVTPLVGQTGSFRVRQGAWRAIYTVENGDVIVERVGDRKRVYR